MDDDGVGGGVGKGGGEGAICAGDAYYNIMQCDVILKLKGCSPRALRDVSRKNITPAAPTNDQPHHRLLWEQHRNQISMHATEKRDVRVCLQSGEQAKRVST